MTSNRALEQLMLDFAERTGLHPATTTPRRYLWTDAFAVCNFLQLHQETGEVFFLDLARALVDQVHRVLGRHRKDDSRSGWISGLSDEQGALHPTRGGLRIGKELPEPPPETPPDPHGEWERDGQYFHYLTQWMHALLRVNERTGEEKYLSWALELAKGIHPRFCYPAPWGEKKRLYWKMSIDLSHPQVTAMGQHDPLDGLVTYHEIEAARAEGGAPGAELEHASEEMSSICRGKEWDSDDALGIGGLLWSACRMAQLMRKNAFPHAGIFEDVVTAALVSLHHFKVSPYLEQPAAYRLPFRELGLAIGLKGIPLVRSHLEQLPELMAARGSLAERVRALQSYRHIAEQIELFWLNDVNRKAATWKDHVDINSVMLATALSPEEYLTA